MKAVVMAGGEGTRLRPLTSNQPKPMVPVAGKPCMEHIIELLRRHGMDDIVVTVAYLPQVIRGYFDDGGELGVEAALLGRGDAARHRRQRQERRGAARRDVPGHLRRRAVRLRPGRAGRGAHASGARSPRSRCSSVENPLEFGVVIIDADGRVERFLEKPSWGQVFSDTINTGVYVLEPEVLRPMPDGRARTTSPSSSFPILLRRGKPMYGHVAEGYWQDIGNLDQYRKANFDALDGRSAARALGHPAARQRAARRGRAAARPGPDRGAGLHRQLLPDRGRGADRAVRACWARTWSSRRAR